MFFLFLIWSFVDVPLIVFCPGDHVPDWQPPILLGTVEARSVNVKKTTVYLSPYSCMVRWYYYRHLYYPLNYVLQCLCFAMIGGAVYSITVGFSPTYTVDPRLLPLGNRVKYHVVAWYL